MLPGECIYAKIITSYTLSPASNINAVGINTNTSTPPDTSGPIYDGDVLLVYNTDPAVGTSTSLTGTLPDKVSSVVTLKSVKKSPLLTKKLPVDAVLKFKGPLPLK